jgi:hypothetical protein
MTKSILALGLFAAAAATAQSRVPVIVELFTSEGCSSCPPADNLLSRMEHDQPVEGVEIVALGEHVDYWDQLGWKDRFSSPLFTARQQEYGQAFHLKDVYTPQLVVNGRSEVLGSDWSAASRAIRAVASDPRALVAMNFTGTTDQLTFEVRRLPQGVANADLLLAVTESNVETSVEKGENAGRKLRHAPLVRSLTSLGQLDTKKNGAYSATARLVLNPAWNRSNLKLVLFVEDHSTKKIVGAATLKP